MFLDSKSQTISLKQFEGSIFYECRIYKKCPEKMWSLKSFRIHLCILIKIYKAEYYICISVVKLPKTLKFLEIICLAVIWNTVHKKVEILKIILDWKQLLKNLCISITNNFFILFATSKEFKLFFFFCH